MRAHRTAVVGIATLLAAAVTSWAQVGRGGSQWLTALADAQRTSWVRNDDKISVESMSGPGFELQWKTALDSRPRGRRGLAQGVTASGVTLFVPMSLVAGSSNRVYGIDNDIGYVLWERRFDLAVPAPTSACPGGMTSGATRIVPLDASATAARASPFGTGRGNPGYRSLLGEPGQGVPVEVRIGSPAAPPPAAASGAAPGTAPPPPPSARSSQPVERIPGTPRNDDTAPFGFLSRPSGVVYVVSSDGMLHVLGLPSGKDMQKPAPFLPANSKWSAPIAVDTTLYAATSGTCGGAPDAIWAIDLDSDAKPVSSWNTNGGSIVGTMAFTSDGMLVAAIGAGKASANGKANAIVALDPKTLQLKDWYTNATTEFVTGPTILRFGDRDIVAAATRDGRIVLLNAHSLGGSDHSTPLVSTRSWLARGGSVSADALAAWQQSGATVGPNANAGTTSWILLPVAGRVSVGVPEGNGSVSAGAIVALKLTDAGGPLSVEPAWVSHDLTAPGTPMIVNGVVFALATGASDAAPAREVPAVLHAYDGVSGRRVWTSGKALTAVASPGSFWSGLGQIYVGTIDGTLHAFGFNDERKP